jgi:hypothetical protein
MYHVVTSLTGGKREMFANMSCGSTTQCKNASFSTQRVDKNANNKMVKVMLKMKVHLWHYSGC